MEFTLIFAPLATVFSLAAWGSYAAWSKGYRKPVFAAIGLIIALAALFFYLSSIATGHYLAGLGEMLIAFALLFGPGAGVILGMASAYNHRIGVALGAVYLLCLASFFVAIG